MTSFADNQVPWDFHSPLNLAHLTHCLYQDCSKDKNKNFSLLTFAKCHVYIFPRVSLRFQKIPRDAMPFRRPSLSAQDVWG